MQALCSKHNTASVATYLLQSLQACGVNILNCWALISSIIVAFAFILAPFAKRIMSATILVFVRRPFAIGDTIMIDGLFKERAIVTKQHLLVTTCEAEFGGQSIYVDNSMANDSTIVNVSRGKDLWVRVEYVCVG